MSLAANRADWKNEYTIHAVESQGKTLNRGPKLPIKEWMPKKSPKKYIIHN